MWSQFFLQNAHFGIGLLSALIMLAAAWLYFDAYLHSRLTRDILEACGFAVLALSFLIYAVTIESNLLSTPLFGNQTLGLLLIITRLGGYLLIILGLAIKPIQPKPQTSSANALPKTNATFLSVSAPFKPLLSGAIAIMYFRQAITGLERHLLPVAIGFVFLTLSELANLAVHFRTADTSTIYSLVAPFGPVWIVEHLLLIVSMVIIGKWVFVYLFKRLLTQLLIIFTSAIVIIFIVTSVTFTGLLVRNVELQTLSELSTNARVLELSFATTQAETLSDAELVAQNEAIQNNLKDDKRSELNSALESILITKKLTTLVVTNSEGRVVGRGENRQRLGEILKEDLLIKPALTGSGVSSVVTHDGVLAPVVSARSAVPIKRDNEIIGAVLVGKVIDNAFVDSLKEATGLEVSIYGGNLLSATSFVASSNNERPIGIKEENKKIKERVLVKGATYLGSTQFLNRPYFAAYVPLKDLNTTPLGMLVIAKPQVSVLQTAAASIETTFLVTVVVLMLSFLPIYLISRNLTRQLE